MSASLHRSLALLLLIVAGVAVYLLVDQVWLGTYRYYQSNAEQFQDRLRRFQAIAAQRPELEAKLQQVRQDSSVDRYYLSQPSPNLAATELQQQVKSIVESNGGRLASTQILPVDEEDSFRKVAIRVQVLVTESEALQKTLHGLETAQPLLFLDNVQMRARVVRKRAAPVNRRLDRRTRQPQAPPPIETETHLTVQFELAGYMRN